MTDMLKSIAPKSDQLNADDLSAGRTLTIKITKVSGVAGEQPIAINYEGDNGKPYMPCKSMRRVLVNVWGKDGADYVGRSLTLYCDPKVMFGGVAVGGLRISHMSHIDKDMTMALTATRSNRKPFTVKPLVYVHVSTPTQLALDPYVKSAGDKAAGEGVVAYTTWLETLAPEVKATVKPYHAAWSKKAKESVLLQTDGCSDE